VVQIPIEGMDANDYRAGGHNLMALLSPAVGSDAIKRLKVAFGDELGDEYQAPDELIEGMLVCGATAVIYGDSNSGKTFFALSLAAAIARGVDCYGRKTDPGIVVYLATEAPGSIRTRLQATKKMYNCQLEDVAIVPVPLNFYTGDGDAMAVIEAIREIERVKGKRVKVVIGDTLARMSAGANENSGEDMGPVMARFEQVCIATGAAMVIIHHNGKDAARGARGWSGIRAHIDTEIEIAEKDGQRSATITKQRELPGKGDIIYFKLQVIEMGETKFGATATTCVAVPDEQAEAQEQHRKPSKHDEQKRLWEAAWWATDAEMEDGFPYISRSGMRDYLAAKRNYSETTLKHKLNVSREDGLVMPMINAGVLEAHLNGWKIICPVMSSAMTLSKGKKK
jgi:hypothetical protein